MSVPLDATLNKYSLEYDYDELADATENFSERRLLGRGSVGAVFRGSQAGGSEVAVKVLEGLTDTGFMEEVRVLSKFRHPNLVILLGFARLEKSRFLVYEYLGGGDVYQRLRKCCSQVCSFSFGERVSVSADAACGLSHLHSSTPRVFHRDIKSANILLDRRGNAKMADFGLSCLSQASSHQVELTFGTLGYADPLYVRRGMLTEGSEVYSFGMVMLELLTSRSPAEEVTNHDGSQGHHFLRDEINYDMQLAKNLIDKNAHWPANVAEILIEFSFTCTHGKEEMRPKFAPIVKMLRSIRDRPDAAKLPKEMRFCTSKLVRPAFNSPGYPPSCSVAHDCDSKSKTVSPAESQVPTPRIMIAARESMEMLNANSAEEAGELARAALAATKAVPRPSDICFLLVLDCIRAEGRNLSHYDEDDLTISHIQEQGQKFSFGRVSHGTFLYHLFPEDKTMFQTVSREHFQIWGQEQYSLRTGTIHTYWLSNNSGSGTWVNDTRVKAIGDVIQIYDDDVIHLPRVDGNDIVQFMSFKFKNSLVRGSFQ